MIFSGDRDSFSTKHNPLYGVTTGVITNNKDPEKIGRVKVKMPICFGKEESDWIRIVTPMSGGSRGIFFLPEVGDEVLIIYREGYMNDAYVLGSLWNTGETPPETNEDGDNLLKKILTKGGHELTFDDTEDEGSITVKTKKGGKIFIDDKKSTMTISAQGGGNVIIIDGEKDEITVKAANKVTVKSGGSQLILDGAGAKVDIKSDATVSVKGASVEIKASGTLDLKSDGALSIKGSIVTIN